MMYWDGNGYQHDAWGWVFMLLWLVLGVIVVILLFRYLLKNEGHRSGSIESAHDILKKRYARGEIDKKEYQEKSRDLKD